MLHLLSTASTHPHVRKLAALLIGYTLWRGIHHEMFTCKTVTVPVVFYHAEQTHLEAPDTATVTIQGKRKYIQTLPEQELAVYIDAKKIPHNTTTLVALNNKQLMLPKQFSVISYKPLLVKKIIL